MKIIIKLILIFSISYSFLGHAEETTSEPEAVGNQSEETSPGSSYVLILNFKDECGETIGEGIPCEVALVYNKEDKKLILVKLNSKSSNLSNSQVDVNSFVKDPTLYGDYSSEYLIASLFEGVTEFETLNARIVQKDGRKNILVSGMSGSNQLIGYIDINNYTD